jgi:hypothetical protein
VLATFWTPMSMAGVFPSLKTTWYAHERAVAKGFPKSIVIMSSGKAVVGAMACAWEEIKSPDAVIDLIFDHATVKCDGMQPFTIKLETTYSGSYLDDVAGVFFGTAIHVYLTREGQERMREESKPLKRWGN